MQVSTGPRLLRSSAASAALVLLRRPSARRSQSIGCPGALPPQCSALGHSLVHYSLHLVTVSCPFARLLMCARSDLLTCSSVACSRVHACSRVGAVLCRCMAHLSVCLLVEVLARLPSLTHVRTQVPLARSPTHSTAQAVGR